VFYPDTLGLGGIGRIGGWLSSRCRRRRVRGAEGTEKRGAQGAEGGGVWGGGFPLPSRLGGLGERRKLPQRGPGQSPGRKRFSVNFPLQKRC